jgi:hypothetical protein
MAILLAVTVLVGLLLPLEQLKLPASWRSRLPVSDGTPQHVGDGDRPSSGRRRPAGPDITEQWGLFTATFVRDRLHALEEELQRLDRDPDVFAKAFHTLAARSAYDALLGEATTVAEQPWWHVGEVLDSEALGSRGGLREVLEF